MTTKKKNNADSEKSARRSSGKEKNASVEQMDVDENRDDEDNDSANESVEEEGGFRIGDIYIPPSAKPHCSTESKGPRLIIKSIENVDFKSYAGKVVLGPFFHRFHAVIGPNGSGKSNVIDSMLFVFGYRAKRIRCGKLSTLLHKSAKYPNVQRCQVTIHFEVIEDAPDGSAITQPGSQFSITRVAHMDNTSHYMIDNTRVHFNLVEQKLKSFDVDLDNNRFLILQGEVESISMMKPKALTKNETGLLEYFEDIIGTKRYKKPLEDINDLVEKLTEERTGKHNLCKLAERAMNELKDGKDLAIAYLQEENEYTRSVNQHIQKTIRGFELSLVDYGAEHLAQKATIEAHDGKYEEYTHERTAKEKSMREERERFDAETNRKNKLESDLKKSFDKYVEFQSISEATKKRQKSMRTQFAKEESALVELRDIPEKNSKAIAEAEVQIEELTEKRASDDAKLQQNMSLLHESTQPLIEEKERLETELIVLQQTVNECMSEVKLAEAELRLCTDAETTEKRKYETFRMGLEDTKSAMKEKSDKMCRLEVEQQNLRVDIDTKQTELKSHTDKERTLSAEIQKIEAQFENDRRIEQMARSQNAVVDCIMREKHAGRLQGVLGRLGDLGGIDKKYAVAISICCGRLDNIVVDTYETGAACIEHLRKVKGGRGNFMALDQMQNMANEMQIPFEPPEDTLRLFDLVKVDDPRVLPALYMALRNTLVAADMTQARRVAFMGRRNRVVTLIGQVIEVSGTMAGGGSIQNIAIKMGQKVQTASSRSSSSMSGAQRDDSNVAQRQAQLIEMKTELNYAQERQGHLEREIVQLQQRLRQVDTELKRLRLDVSGLQQHLPRQEQQVAAQKTVMERTKADPKRAEELNKKIQERSASLDEATSNSGSLKERVNAVKAKIKKVTTDQVGNLEKRIAEMDKQIAALKKNVLKLNMEIDSSERNVAKVESTIETLRSDIEVAQEQIDNAGEERAALDKHCADLSAAIAQLTGELQQLQCETSAVRKKIDELKELEKEGQLSRLELVDKLQKIEANINHVKQSIPHWRKKFEPLKLNVIPTDVLGSPKQIEQAEQDERDGKLSLVTYSNEELDEMKVEDLQYTVSYLEESLKSKTPNISMIDDFFKKRQAYLDRVSVLEEITLRRNEMLQVYDDVRKRRYHEFLHGFTIISKRLREMYQMITQGGDAELELMDSMDPFSEGVSFSVRPPKKSWKNISNLSGGEKTLSSLALVFALHYYKPSPLYFMDEIDAALDFKNVSIVANYIKSRTKNAQFIIISLRSNMFDLSDYLTGIYKVCDCTRSITINSASHLEHVQQGDIVTSTQRTDVNLPTICHDLQVEEISFIQPEGSQFNDTQSQEDVPVFAANIDESGIVPMETEDS